MIPVKKLSFKINRDEDCSCGELIAIEALHDIPFEIKRIFYIYDVSGDVSRGAHAHRNSNQLLICVHGSCEIILDDGNRREYITLDSPQTGLLQPRLVWGEMQKFSEDAVLMVLSDSYYDPDDYIHDYDELRKLTGAR